MKIDDVHKREPEALRRIREHMPDTTASGMLPVDYSDYVEGVGFFPYGSGLWHCSCTGCTGVPRYPCCSRGSFCGEQFPSFPYKKFMILGHDFGNVRYFAELHDRCSHARIPATCELAAGSRTWYKLIELLVASGVSPRDCFFTNAFMGKRDERYAMTGENPSYKGENTGGERYRRESFKTFLTQVMIQQPTAIICLGMQVFRFLQQGTSIQLATMLKRFSHEGRYKDLEKDLFVLKDVPFTCEDQNVKTSIVLVVHPSTLNRNLDGLRLEDDMNRIRALAPHDPTDNQKD